MLEGLAFAIVVTRKVMEYVSEQFLGLRLDLLLVEQLLDFLLG